MPLLLLPPSLLLLLLLLCNLPATPAGVAATKACRYCAVVKDREDRSTTPTRTEPRTAKNVLSLVG
jgi:hypothetical protein